RYTARHIDASCGPDADGASPQLRRRPVGSARGRRVEAQSPVRGPTLGVFFWTVIRNSVFDCVFLNRSSSSSSACCCSREPSTRRSFHMIASSSRPISSSSRRVADALTFTAGKIRLSARLRGTRRSVCLVTLLYTKLSCYISHHVSTSPLHRWASTLWSVRMSARLRLNTSSISTVPLYTTKITSSIFDPVSTSAEGRMVSDPPCSMLRAAPKNRLGGYSAEASTPPERIRPEA